MAQTTVSIRMDEDLKKQAEILFSDFGMNLKKSIGQLNQSKDTPHDIIEVHNA